MNKKGFIGPIIALISSSGGILLILIIFLIIGSSQVQVQKISFFINEEEKIVSQSYESTKVKNFDKWFNSYEKGDYDIKILSCDPPRQILKYISNVGQSDIIIYLDNSKISNKCLMIELEKFGVKKDGVQVFLPE